MLMSQLKRQPHVLLLVLQWEGCWVFVLNHGVALQKLGLALVYLQRANMKCSFMHQDNQQTPMLWYQLECHHDRHTLLAALTAADAHRAKRKEM